MDILASLTSDFDHLRDLTVELAIAEKSDRNSIFRQLCRYQDVTMKAQEASLYNRGELEFIRRKMLERSDMMEEIATSVQHTVRPEMREAKMELYVELILQRIRDTEKEILPTLNELLSVSEKTSMGRAYEKYRDVALNHEISHAG